MGTLQLSTPEQKQALAEQQPATIATSGLTSQPAVDGTAASLSSDDPGPMKGKKLETEQAIVLENAAAGFVKPNVLDLKLGARLWDDEAPPAKRQRLDDVANKTTSGSLGFRIAGMRVWKTGKQDFQTYDKLYGRQFDKDSVMEGFKEYLGLNGEAQANLPELRSVLDIVQKEIETARAALEVMELRIYSASILVVYEGDPATLKRAIDAHQKEVATAKAQEEEGGGDGGRDADDDDGQCLPHTQDSAKAVADSDEDVEGPQICRVVMIDFAHASFVRGQGRDENVLRGLDGVLDVLEKLS